MTRRALACLVALPLLLVVGCSNGDGPLSDPKAAASAPIPGVTLPPGPLLDLVPKPDEVPAGMVPVILGSGPRDLNAVAGYSGTGTTAATAAASLKAHGFQAAYVAQFANEATGQVLSVVVSRFATAEGATADFGADTGATFGTTVQAETVGEASVLTSQQITGKAVSELLLLRFRRGTDTWVLAYQAVPPADPQVPVMLAKTVLARTTT